MVNLKFGAFIFTLCLLLTSCVCESTNDTTKSCTIEDTTASCDSNQDLKSLLNHTDITKLIVKGLKRINKDDFETFINLMELDFSNSELEEIDPKAFASLTKLHTLNLSGNTKLKIPDDGILVSDTLTSLNMSKTFVEQIHETFSHLPQLSNLDLSGTNVKDFSPLENLKHLTKLTVSKTNETETLCNELKIEEIIEKDENGTETSIDCKTIKKEVLVNTTEETTTEKKPEETTTIAAKLDEPKIENKTEEILNKTEIEPKEATVKPTQETTTAIKVVTEAETAKTETESTTTTEVVVKLLEEKPAVYVNHPGNPEPVITEQPKIKPEEHVNAIPEEKVDKTEKMIAAPKMKDLQPENEKPKVVSGDADDVLLPSTENTSQSNGVNIVLGIILCVMIVGAVGFGYKYWKNRRSGYTHANTQDNEDEDKELQTIVAHRTDPDQN